MTQLRDGTKISFRTGMKMLKIFKEKQIEGSIFDSFPFMDEREEKLRVERSMQRQLEEQNMIQKGGSGTKKDSGNGRYKRHNNRGNHYGKRRNNPYRGGRDRGDRGGRPAEYTKKSHAQFQESPEDDQTQIIITKKDKQKKRKRNKRNAGKTEEVYEKKNKKVVFNDETEVKQLED